MSRIVIMCLTGVQFPVSDIVSDNNEKYYCIDLHFPLNLKLRK